ncbi:MAG TPA: ATP-binding protein [Burkholderiaceae bacterium]|nr:ATP-binding protein [Burkholderiaceae bacterium]
MQVEVRDTGPGIQVPMQSRLFTPFDRLDLDHRHHVSGIGIGLALSRSLVELMGGEMGFDTEPGRGSTFWFTLLAAP